MAFNHVKKRILKEILPKTGVHPTGSITFSCHTDEKLRQHGLLGAMAAEKF